MSQRNALIGTAALELGAGLPLVLAPQLAAELLSLSLSPHGVVMTRFFGLAICVLGVIAWQVRDETSALGTSIQRSFAAYHFFASISCGFLFFTGTIDSPLLLGPCLFHGLLCAALLGVPLRME